MNKKSFFLLCCIPFIFVLLLSISSKAIGQNKTKEDLLPPKLSCISVLDENSVQLNWSLPQNVNPNYSFIIYFSYNPSGPYTKIDSLPYYRTSYLHSGILPYSAQLFYYVKSCSLTVANHNIYSFSSDTLKTMMMNFIDHGDGTVNLTWNSISHNIINGSGEWYYIYREYPTGVWSKRDSVSIHSSSLSHEDTIDICGAYLNYKIVLPDSLGCSSVSTIHGKYLMDLTIPHPPIIDYVTVDTIINKNVIKWQPDQSGDTKGYYINKYINPNGITIDTVMGRYNTTYTHMESEPMLDNETYYIIAFDSCNQSSAGSKYHNSIFLSILPDRCEYNIKLSWNPYINMESGLKGYQVYKKTRTTPYELISTVSSNNNFYIDNDVITNGEYTYYIRAIDSSETRFSISNIQTLKFSYPRRPDFNYLRKATVKGINQIEIKIYVDTTAYISEYHLCRLDNNGRDTTLIQNMFHLITTDINFVDNAVNTNEKSYQYILKLKDLCNNENLMTSNVGSTIYVKASMMSGMKNFLKWNKYKTWAGNVSHYNVYRKTENGWEFFPIITIEADENDTITYIDDVSNLGDTNGQFAYYIEAIEGTGNPYGFVDTSYSNITYVNQYPKLFVPNAFAPEGYNNTFLPIMGFVHPEDYLMQIYDRWGALIFETTDKYQGWDGTFNNSDAPKGVYIYLIKIKNSNNEIIEKRGTVTLIR